MSYFKITRGVTWTFVVTQTAASEAEALTVDRTDITVDDTSITADQTTTL